MKTRHKAAAVAAATIIAATVPFLKGWEGMDLVARRDPIGTGHPLTYCSGLTAVDGSVKAGQRFTPSQCDARLAVALPKYLAPLQRCVTVAVPVKVMAALLDASYNAGPVAVCHSSMISNVNSGDLTAACNAFKGWYVRASGVVRRGLINRRNAEAKLCLAGVAEGLPKPSVAMPWWQRMARVVTFKS